MKDDGIHVLYLFIQSNFQYSQLKLFNYFLHEALEKNGKNHEKWSFWLLEMKFGMLDRDCVRYNVIGDGKVRQSFWTLTDSNSVKGRKLGLTDFFVGNVQ